MFPIFKGQQIDLSRDYSSLFMIILLPVLLVFILGTMLAALDNPDMEIEPMTVGYVVSAEDQQTNAIVDAIAKEFDDQEKVEFIPSKNLETAKTQLSDGELSALVVFSQPFSIEIHDGSDTIQNRAVHAIFESVARLHGVTTVLMSATQFAPDGAVNSLETSQNDSQTRVEEKIFGVSRSMIDYYAITMTVMMLFMGSAAAGANTLHAARKDGTLRRTLASPQSRLSIYFQYVVSGVPYNLIQVGVVMLVSVTLLGAHYAVTWEANLLLFLMLFVTGIAVSSLSSLLGIFIRISPFAAIMPLAWTMLFLSGTFSKEIFIPGFSNYLPPAVIQQAAFDLTLFGQTGRALAILGVSLAVLVVATIVGAAVFNKKEIAS